MSALVKKLLVALALLFLTACQKLPVPQTSQAAPAQDSARQRKGSYGPPIVIGELKDPEINESSGLVASRLPGVYWTHNDSGDGPFIYAVDEKGGSRGVWRVAGAAARDWEDIAAGPGPQRNKRYLYVGDIGDNNADRSELVIYRVPEPAIAPSDAAATKSKPRATGSAEAIKLRYPDGKHDAETLLVHPVSGNIFIITKVLLANAMVYEASAPLNTAGPTTLVRKAELNVPSLLGGLITGGDISPDGRRVALCDYLQGYELVLPGASRDFDDIWKQPMSRIDLGRRRQGEAIAYRLDGRALLMTSEGVHSPLIQVGRR
jgi:hypothetical protein